MNNEFNQCSWNNLKNNPDSMPYIDIDVLILYEHCAGDSEYLVAHYDGASWCAHNINCSFNQELYSIELNKNKVLAWRYIEPYEVNE